MFVSQYTSSVTSHVRHALLSTALTGIATRCLALRPHSVDDLPDLGSSVDQMTMQVAEINGRILGRKLGMNRAPTKDLPRRDGIEEDVFPAQLMRPKLSVSKDSYLTFYTTP